jgi:hypothetical protein
MTLVTRYCHECGRDQAFGQPHDGRCRDVPDGDCPEWVCTGCGAALITGIAYLRPGRRELPQGRVA